MENAFGEELHVLKTPFPKAILNLILVGLGAFAGLTLALANMAIVGVPILILSLIFAGFIIKRQLGRAVYLYESGMVVKDKGQESRYHLDDLTDVKIQVTARGDSYKKKAVIRAYTFYAGDSEVVAIGSSFPSPDWQHFGGTFNGAVATRITLRLLQRFNQGETITLSNIRQTGLVKDSFVTLTITKSGIKLGNNPLMEWSQIQQINWLNSGRANASVEIIGQGERQTFGYFNSRGSIVAHKLLTQIQSKKLWQAVD